WHSPASHHACPRPQGRRPRSFDRISEIKCKRPPLLWWNHGASRNIVEASGNRSGSTPLEGQDRLRDCHAVSTVGTIYGRIVVLRPSHGPADDLALQFQSIQKEKVPLATHDGHLWDCSAKGR